jgi:hypothetical protein
VQKWGVAKTGGLQIFSGCFAKKWELLIFSSCFVKLEKRGRGGLVQKVWVAN